MTKIKEAYKETEIGIIPKEWDVMELGNCFEFYGGYPIPRSQLTDKGVKYLHYGDIHTNTKTYISSVEDSSWLPRAELKSVKNNAELHTGDIVLADASEDYEGVGKSVVIINEDNSDFAAGLHTIIGKEKKQIFSLNYKRYFLQPLDIKKQLKKLATGSKVYGITKGNLAKVKIAVPSMREQEIIGSNISDIEKHIERLNDIIEDYGLLKKAATKKLLTEGIGHKEFEETEVGMIPKAWKIYKIEDICKLGRGRVISKKEIEDNKGIYPVYSSQTTNNGCMGMINTYDFEGEYVTWTTDGVNAGMTFYRKGRFNCTNVCGTLKLKEKDFDPRYLSLILNQFTDKYVVRSGNPKLMNNIMALIQIPVPDSLEEQNIIADIIFSFDDIINIYQSEKDEYVKLKKNLIERLLTGKIRV